MLVKISSNPFFFFSLGFFNYRLQKLFEPQEGDLLGPEELSNTILFLRPPEHSKSLSVVYIAASQGYGNKR